jgi:hypothetical protein
MTRRLVLLSIPTVLFAQQRKSKDKGPEVELLEATARVEDGVLLLDGRLKNVSEKSIRGLTIIFEVLDPNKNVLTKQQGPIEEKQLEPGEEGRFEVQMAFHARAVWFRMWFEDGGARELRAEKTGPFPIEQ